MNHNGLARGYMAKSLPEEKFLYHVVACVEKQLKYWSEENSLLLILGKNTNELFVSQRESVFHIDIPEWIVKQKKGLDPYSLDRYIWSELIRKGVEIESKSNYIKLILKSLK
jgi:hypothetical protein